MAPRRRATTALRPQRRAVFGTEACRSADRASLHTLGAAGVTEAIVAIQTLEQHVRHHNPSESNRRSG
jgi:3-oxoacyl-(acyl-carrier-protein) synthase